MTIQLPSLSLTDKQALSRQAQVQQDIPYTFQINRAGSPGTNFPGDTGVGTYPAMKYVTVVWTPPVSIFIYRFRFVSGIIDPAGNVNGNRWTVCQVNLTPTPTTAVITKTTTSGNCLYHGFHRNYSTIGGKTVDDNNHTDVMDLYPKGFYISANTPLYIIFGKSREVDGAITYMMSLIVSAITTPTQS